MSVESVNQFYQQLMQEPALRQQFQAALDRESLVNLAVEVGQQKGYKFTAEEVKQALTAQSVISEAEELSDQQLETVAGGSGKRGNGERLLGQYEEQPPGPPVSIVKYSGSIGEYKC
ncbi:MAG: Nif11-like leader peptide family natural product precursor [Microcoleus sp. CSU_2_2]|nr:Nif11-like leader peptide family natural product precursor [Microcoleus sp. CSU_2_2]